MSTISYLEAGAPACARAALRARLELLAMEDELRDALPWALGDAEVTVHEDGGVTVRADGVTVTAGPFAPCSDRDWERLVASVRYWTAPERGVFGATVLLREVEDQVAVMPQNMAGVKVTAGDLRLALRYCAWEPARRRGTGEVWARQRVTEDGA